MTLAQILKARLNWMDTIYSTGSKIHIQNISLAKELVYEYIQETLSKTKPCAKILNCGAGIPKKFLKLKIVLIHGEKRRKENEKPLMQRWFLFLAIERWLNLCYNVCTELRCSIRKEVLAQIILFRDSHIILCGAGRPTFIKSFSDRLT